MGKKAIVLGGGGAKGSYQIGVWRALREIGYDYDVVTGTSVGALNGALMVQGDFETALRLWQEVTTKDVLGVEKDVEFTSISKLRSAIRSIVSDLVKNGGIDPVPLENILRKYVDEEKVLNSPVKFAAITCAYPSLKPFVISQDTVKKGELVDYLLASAACFPPMKARKIGERLYIDGGYHDNVPANLAVEMGADDIITVDLESVGMGRAVRSRNASVRCLRSYWNLGQILHFSPDVAKANITLGYLDAMKMFKRYEGAAYTFERDSWREYHRAIGAKLDIIEYRTGFNIHKHVPAKGELQRDIRLCDVKYDDRDGEIMTEALVVCAAQSAARVFDISPHRVYTARELTEAVALAYRDMLSYDVGDISAAFEGINTPAKAQRDVQSADKKHITAYYCRRLGQMIDTGRRDRALRLLCYATPDEFAAAMFILALRLCGMIPEHKHNTVIWAENN